MCNTHVPACMPYFCRVRTYGALLGMGLGLPACRTKQAAPTKLRQALNRGVLRGSGGTQQQFLGHGDVLERLQHHPGTERKCENTTQPAFQMHRDLNVAWNLWNVLAAEYAGLPRPAC